MSNPWNLPPREAEVMTRMADRGAEKVVAAELGISPYTVKELVARAKKRIGAKTRLCAVVEWDSWERSHG